MYWIGLGNSALNKALSDIKKPHEAIAEAEGVPTLFFHGPRHRGTLLLADHPKFIATPQSAAFTKGALFREAADELEDIGHGLYGKPAVHTPSGRQEVNRPDQS